jgi:hypothetical protein
MYNWELMNENQLVGFAHPIIFRLLVLFYNFYELFNKAQNTFLRINLFLETLNLFVCTAFVVFGSAIKRQKDISFSQCIEILPYFFK